MLRLKNRKLYRKKPKDRVEIGYEKSESGFHADCKNATDCAVKSLEITGARYNFIASHPITDANHAHYGEYETTVAIAGKNCIKQIGEKTLEIPDQSAKNHGIIGFDKWRSIFYNRYYFISFDYEIEPFDDGTVPPVYMTFAYGKLSSPLDYVIQYNGTPSHINPNGEASSSFSVILIRVSYTEYTTGAPLLKFYFNAPSEQAMTGNGKITVKNVVWSEVQDWGKTESADDFVEERIVQNFYTEQPIASCATASDEVSIEASTGKVKIIKKTAYKDKTVYEIDTPYEITIPTDTPIMLRAGEPNRVYLKSPSPPLSMTVKYFSSVR